MSGMGGIIAVMDTGFVRYIGSLSDMKGISRWIGIKDAAIGTGHAVGLLVDGTVVRQEGLQPAKTMWRTGQYHCGIRFQ